MIQLWSLPYLYQNTNINAGRPYVNQFELIMGWEIVDCCRKKYPCIRYLFCYSPGMMRRESLQWRHNGQDGVSNHQLHDCLLNLLFKRRSKKTSKLRATCLCAGNSPGPVNSLHKRPITRKTFPFDDVIMATIVWILKNGCFDCSSDGSN